MIEAKTSREFFEKTLPARFKPEKAAGIDVVAQINVAGSNGGNWVITIRDQKMQVKEGTTPAPTLTLKVAENDFMDLVNNKLSAEKAFFTGRVHFEGSLSLALKLRDAGFF